MCETLEGQPRPCGDEMERGSARSRQRKTPHCTLHLLVVPEAPPLKKLLLSRKWLHSTLAVHLFHIHLNQFETFLKS